MSNPVKPRVHLDIDSEIFRPAKLPGVLGVFLFKQLLSLAAALMIVVAPLGSYRTVLAQECPAPETKRLSLTPIIRDMVNPTPSESDFELPMPCGGKLILRHVCVPAEQYLGDAQLNLGCVNCGRPDQGFMDGKHIETIAGVFKEEDLPESWRVKLRDLARQGDGRCPSPDEKEPGAFYYFIGKYEVATFQWKAIMDNECPGWDVRFTSDDPRPITNVSWFEAVEFTRRYTEWLLKNRPDVLPGFGAGRTGYIRLPTETEWEYAARGGHVVTESAINQEDFFPLNNRTYSDYAVYTGADAAKPTEKLAWIGTRCSNPLGLFDTAGNAAEMMLDPFHFSIDFRLHGAAGGFVVKGGSYRKRISEIMPGRREEMPFFLKDGPFRSTDLGFRVVLSGIVNPHERNEALRRQWAEIARPARKPESAIVIDPARDLLGEIERLIAAAKDEVEQRNLFVIKDYLKKANAEIAEQKAEAFEAVIWKALFAVESIHKFTSRCKQLQKEYDELKVLRTQALPETEMESLKANLANLAEQIRSCDAVVDYFVHSYLDSIAKSHDFPEEAIAHQFDRIFKSPRLSETYRLRLEDQLGVVKKHITLYNNHPDDINFAIIKEDILSYR
ncbi:MAG: SUMF1/EgtB/PvdO family nonheme iron enzyme [Desulfobacterales bacterium]|nr:MAG: SUMF1/EgtB/PvdO family nonheme iron enzyme [Desulfobacterales bacterium]